MSDDGTLAFDGILVRLVVPGEHEEAGRVVVAAYSSLPGGHMTHSYARELADVARRAAEAEVLVAVDLPDQKVLGCVTFVPDASSPWAELLEDGESGIRMLGVDPLSHRRAVATALLEACVRRALRLGREGLVLHTTPWMQAAQRLYEKAGFVRIPARDWKPEPDVPLLAYRLDLKARRDERLGSPAQRRALGPQPSL